jgi:transposase
VQFGEFVPGEGERIRKPEDLPEPIIEHRSRCPRRTRCPGCGKSASRDQRGQRWLWDIGDLRRGRPRRILVEYSKHHCRSCNRYFNADMTDLAEPAAQYTARAMALALRTVVEDGLSLRGASWRLWRDHRLFVPFATLQSWVEAAGEKRSARS